MSKSIVVDRVKVIAEMARQNLTGEELAQKAGVGRSAVIKMRKGQPVWRTTAGHVARILHHAVGAAGRPGSSARHPAARFPPVL